MQRDDFHSAASTSSPLAGPGAAPSPSFIPMGAHGLDLDPFGRVAAPCRTPLGGLDLVAPAGAAIRRRGDALVLTGGAIRIAGADIPADIDISPETGAVRFAMQAPPWAMAVELRYFYAKAPGPSGAAGIGALRYPVFDGTLGGPIAVTGRFDPARPGDPANGLTLAAAGPGQALTTHFRTTLGRAIALSPIAGKSGIAYRYDPAERAFYPAPKGDWLLHAPGGVADADMLLGLSGLEFGRIDGAGMLRFVADAPAYAPGFGQTGGTAPGGLTATCPGAAHPVTTPWIYPLAGPTGPSGPTGGAARGYYSQPRGAGYYAAGPQGVFLDLLPLPAGGFPAPADLAPGGATGVMGAAAASFPSAPYGGVTAGAASPETYQAFETEILGPARFAAIAEIDANAALFSAPMGMTAPTGPTGPGGPKIRAVTPGGLMSEFSADLKHWDRLILARSETQGRVQELQLTGIDAALRRALLGNQLFLVISDHEKLMQHASVRYAVGAEVIATFAALSAPPAVMSGLAALRARGTYLTRALFEPEAKIALGPDFKPPSGPSWGALLLREAALATLTVGGWHFDLSPDRWVGAGGENTIMIVKFADRPLEDLVEDLDAWTMADAFNASPADTRARLRRIIADARAAAAGGERDFDHFVDIVGGGAQSWNGALFLNVYVPKSAFPPQIEGLAAGIAAPEFRAHHLGVDLSPVAQEGGDLRLRDSALFGLIHYVDPDDLVFRGDPYDYKVLSLKILFANSQIASFSSRIELLIAALFGERARLRGGEHGNNILLDGVWQKHGGADSYSFSMSGLAEFEMESHVLQQVAITRAQFVTEAPNGAAGARAGARFLLWGGLGYRAPKGGGFDLFSFGPEGAGETGGELVFSNMYVAMDFSRLDPTDRRFAFEAGRMAFDPSSSVARPGSLFRRFPLSVAGMVQGAPALPPGPTGATGATGPAPHAATPRDLGFIPVATPLGTGSLGPEWYGLEMDLNLGTRGALAGQAPIAATLLASWAPDEAQANLALGLRLPGSDGRSIQIAGPLKIDIGAIEMMFAETDEAYLMRLRSIALDFLGVKFPPGGKTNLLLFGDPNPDSNNAALGWYAAYKKDDEKKKDDGAKAALAAPADGECGE